MNDINPQEKNLLVTKTVGAMLFSVFGCLGFFFSVWKKNWNSALWCLLLEITCVAVLSFNRLYLRSQLHMKFTASAFRVLKFVLLALAIGSLAATVAYIVVGAQGQETFHVSSHYAAAPVALLTGFWSVILFFDFRKYEALLN